MHLNDLEWLRMEAEGLVIEPRVSDDLDQEFRDVETRLQPLYSGDVGEFVSKVLRDAYRNDDRENPLCECSDPACDLKSGRLPYPLRRRQSPEKSAPNPEDLLRNYLKRHPDAIVVDEALEELQAEKVDIAATLRSIIRRGKAQYHADDEDGDEDADEEQYAGPAGAD